MANPRSVADMLRRSARALARATVVAMEVQRPGFVMTALPESFASPDADIEVRILQLAEAIAVDAPLLFTDAVVWYRTALSRRGVADDYLAATIDALCEVLVRELPQGAEVVIAPVLALARRSALAVPRVPPCPIEAPSAYTLVAQRFLLAMLEGNGDEALDIVREAIRGGASVAAIHDHVLAPAQREVGHMWMLGEAPIADEHFASQLAGQVLLMLQERVARPSPTAPHVVAFAVQGNLHELGVRVIAQRLQLAGYRVTNLGADLPASDLPWAIGDRPCDLLAVSATMLLHLGQARSLVELRDRDLHGKPPILLGGAPFARIPDLHLRLGAEAGAGDAEAAVLAAHRLAPIG